VQLGSDAAADWGQEASVLVWTMRIRLADLPPESRAPYARTCLRRSYADFIQRERRCRASWALEQDRGSDAGASWLEVEAALRRLRPAEVQLLECFYFKGMTDREVAGCLRTTPQAAKARRARALGKLRRLLQEPG
jgi:RNA polymerase sigma factor (sigma-70 family)